MANSAENCSFLRELDPGSGFRSLGEEEAPEVATRSVPIVPLKRREMRNQQSAQWLAYKYTLTNVEQPPDKQ